jgi:condensin complex subunit 2
LIHFFNFWISSANINVTKLDFAFDIDPLFHKMSQQFDEGGAKGLLLVNLGVASDGCRLVLDSKEDAVSDFDLGFLFDDDMVDIHSLSILDSSCVIDHDGQNQQQQDRDIVSPLPEGIIDVTKLRDKLQELILMAPLESIDLVPQLSELRSEQEHLKSLGFLDVPRTQTDVSP